MKFAAMTGLVLVCLLWNSGCNRNAEQDTTEPLFEGVEATIVVPPGLGFQEAWELSIREELAQSGATLILRESLSETGSVQIVVFRDLIDRSKEKPFERLTALGKSIEIEDVFQGLREKVCTWNTELMMVPLSVPVLVCYYREDLLKKAGLKPPETWEEYGNLVEKLPEWAPGMTCVEPWSKEFRATMFLARSVAYAKPPGQFSCYLDIDTGAPLIDSPGFVRGLDTLSRIREKISPQSLSFSPLECRREIIEGRAALAIGIEDAPEIVLSGAIKRVEKVKRAKEIQISAIQLPGVRESYNRTIAEWERLPSTHRVPLVGFAGLVITVSKEIKDSQKAAAISFLGMRLKSAGGFPLGVRSIVREEDLSSSAEFLGEDWSSQESGDIADAIALSLRDRQIIAELPMIGSPQLRDSLAAGLTAWWENPGDSQAALSLIGAEWKKQIKDLGEKQVLESYQRSIGVFVKMGEE